MNILLLDNNDSFTYNLVQMIEEIIENQIDVIKSDSIEFESISVYDKIILSPGPGIPKEAGKLLEVISRFKNKIPILGVCLGHQAIAETFGGKLRQLDKVQHGVESQIFEVEDEVLFEGISLPMKVGRYHSWVVDEQDFPKDLEITSKDENGIIMSLKHRFYPISSVQFHPESILTPQGRKLLQNWLYCS